MRINNTFSKLYVGSMIIASTLISCTKKPFVQMPAERISKEAAKEITNYRNDAQEILKDTAYVLYGKDTLLLGNNFKQHIQNKAKSAVKEITVDKEMVTTIQYYSGKTQYVPEIKYIKEPEFIEPKAVIRDTTIFTTDSVNIYLPVEYYGKPNPKAIPL